MVDSFVIRTDHSSLRWLMNFKNPEGQLARWLHKIQEYDMLIEHRRGKYHLNADALSRRPCIKPSCKHCDRADSKEHAFRQLGREDSNGNEECNPNMAKVRRSTARRVDDGDDDEYVQQNCESERSG